MTGQANVWCGKARLLGRSHLATQAAVLLPVIVIAALTAWTMSAPTSARGQPAGLSAQAGTPSSAATREPDLHQHLNSRRPNRQRSLSRRRPTA